ncbi:hypothetical protein [Undibacterium sp. Di24W]|uniref:hypothetical protein n=1 Tax=Undibacterium sp. Di24W TaxID=3413033 RepID=UPI003BF09781
MQYIPSKLKNSSYSTTNLALKLLVGVIIYGIFIHKMTANANAENVILQASGLSYPLASQVDAPVKVLLANEDKADLRKLLISKTHYQDSEINLEIGLHQISLNIVNSRSNEISRKLRAQDATSIALILERAIKTDHQFSDVTAIHVSYVKVNGDITTIVQAFDFYQTSAGAFIRNRS